MALLLGVAVVSSVSCGQDPLLLAEADHSEPPVVKLATPEQIAKETVAPASYIVTFRGAVGSSRRAFASFAAEVAAQWPELIAGRYSDPRITDMTYVTTVNLANPKEPAQIDALAPPAALRLLWNQERLDEVPAVITVVNFRDQESAAAVLAEWEAGGDIWFAEPNHVNYLFDDSPFTKTLADTYKSANIWWHTAIKLPEAMASLAASPSATLAQAPIIAVLDSGLDVTNPAIKDHLWQNPSPGASGCPDDIYGCDTTRSFKGALGQGMVNPYGTSAYGESCPVGTSQDEQKEQGICGHGTHVAGIIAASILNSPQGWIGGVCPVCKIMPIKIIAKIGKTGGALDSAILAAFKYLSLFRNQSAVVRVANSSFGKYQRARAVALLISLLKKTPNEILVIGAAGNEDSMLRSYPAGLPDAVAVSAVGVGDAKAAYSNFGPWVTVAAPGGDDGPGQDEILSTVPGSEMVAKKKGTSMACPVVAGLAGLVLAAHPERGWQELRDSIVNTTDGRLYSPSVNKGINLNYYYPKIAGEALRRPLLGSGIVDAVAALAGKQGSGVQGSALNRVDGGCSVGSRVPGDGWLWLLVVCGPLAWIFLARLKSTLLGR